MNMVEVDYALKISIALRTFLMQSVSIIAVTAFMNECLNKRHSYKVLVIWQLFRCVLINAIFTVVFEDLRFANPELQKIYAIVYSTATLITVCAYIYTFKDVAKTLCLFFVGEFPVVLLTSIVVAIVGFLEHRSANYTHPFIALDLLIPALEYLAVRTLIKLGKPYFYRFREYELHHPKLWCTFALAYVIPSSILT